MNCVLMMSNWISYCLSMKHHFYAFAKTRGHFVFIFLITMFRALAFSCVVDDKMISNGRL
jgi:hypothetical protein